MAEAVSGFWANDETKPGYISLADLLEQEYANKTPEEMRQETEFVLESDLEAGLAEAGPEVQ